MRKRASACLNESWIASMMHRIVIVTCIYALWRRHDLSMDCFFLIDTTQQTQYYTFDIDVYMRVKHKRSTCCQSVRVCKCALTLSSQRLIQTTYCLVKCNEWMFPQQLFLVPKYTTEILKCAFACVSTNSQLTNDTELRCTLSLLSQFKSFSCTISAQMIWMHNETISAEWIGFFVSPSWRN